MRPWAEIRRTRAEGLRIPALCLAVAVAAMTATRGFEQQSAQALGREARGLAGADLEVTSPRPLPEAELQCAKAAAGAGWRHASLRDFLSMAAIPGTSRSRLVEVRAWGEGYPFYGKFVTLGAEDNKSGASQPLKNDPKKTAHARLKKPTRSSPTAPLPPLLTQDDLLAQLDWKPGEAFQLGKQKFQLQGRVSDETTTAGSAFALGPRVWIPLKDLPSTGLAGPESRVRYREVFATPLGLSATDSELTEKRAVIQKCLKDPASQARTYREASPQLRGFFKRLSEFLGLLSLLVALLGGTGIAFAMRVKLQAEEKTLAILSCLGASRKRIGRTLFQKALILGVFSSTLGALSGLALGQALPRLARGLFPFQVSESPLSFWAAGEAWATGVALCLVFSALGQATLPWGKPLSLLREDALGSDGPEKTNRFPLSQRFRTGGLTLGLLLLLGFRQTQNWVGPAAVISLLGIGAVLHSLLFLALGFLEKLTSRWDGRTSLAVRLGLRHLWRQKGRSALAASFLTLATLLVGSMLQLRSAMLQELEAPQGAERPQFFLIDLGDEDRPRVETLIQKISAKGASLRFSKLVPARLRSINDSAPRTQEDAENRSREFRLTERATLYSSERITRGRFWQPNSRADESSVNTEVEASIEAQWAERSGVGLGDILKFEIQGVSLSARVTSIRTVQWARFEPNFFVVLQPGALEGAPFSWIASASGLDQPESRQNFQREMAKNIPTATLIDVQDASKKLALLVRKIEAVVRFVSLFSWLTGSLGVALIALESARHRAREMALLGILGAKKTLITRALRVEFGVLGVTAAGVGTALSSLVAGALLARQFGLPAPAPDAALAALGVFTALGVVLASTWASRRNLKESPLSLFRSS